LDATMTPMDVMDFLIAASALIQDLILETRNVKDFIGSQVKLVNSWE
jgi:toxin FitB